MNSKMNVRRIIKDHFATLHSNIYPDEPLRRSWWDYSHFLGLPLFVAAIFVYFNLFPSEQMTEGLLNALAIFAGLLLNLLVLFHSLIRKKTTPLDDTTKTESRTPIADLARKEQKDIFSNILKETYYNTAYAVLVALGAIIFLLAVSVDSPILIKKTFATCLYFLLGNFLLTLLMILKRMHILLSVEFDEKYKAT